MLFEDVPCGSSTVSPSAVAASLRAWSAETSVTGARPAAWCCLAEFEGDGQLHGVVGPEPVLAGLEHGVVEEGRGQLDDAVTLGRGGGGSGRASLRPGRRKGRRCAAAG